MKCELTAARILIAIQTVVIYIIPYFTLINVLILEFIIDSSAQLTQTGRKL